MNQVPRVNYRRRPVRSTAAGPVERRFRHPSSGPGTYKVKPLNRRQIGPVPTDISDGSRSRDMSDDASNHQRPSEENNGEIILNHDVLLSGTTNKHLL